MSANIETVKAIYGCFGRGDLPGLLAHLDPDVEWEHDWGGDPLPYLAPRRGRAEVGEFFAAMQDYDFVRFEPAGFLADADRVAVPVHVELRHKTTGRGSRDLEMHLFTFGPDGKVTRVRHFLDTRQFAAMAAPAAE